MLQSNALTRRERQVLALVAQGESNREIGRRLGCAENTVKRHMTGVYDKLGISSRGELAARRLQVSVERRLKQELKPMQARIDELEMTVRVIAGLREG